MSGTVYDQSWVVPATLSREGLAHLLPANPRRERGAVAALCGERRRSWEPLADVNDDNAATLCSTCQRRWRQARPQLVQGVAVPGRYRQQFEDYLQMLSRDRIATHTRQTYAKNAAAFLRWAADQQLAPRSWATPAVTGRYQGHLEESGLAARTINVRLLASADLTQRLTGRATASGRLRVLDEPAQLLRPSQQAAVRVAARRKSEVADLLVEVMLGTGAKPGEVMALDVADVEMGPTWWTVRLGRRTVEVSEPPPSQLRDRVTGGSGPLLMTRRGGRLQERHTRRLLTEIGEEAALTFDLTSGVLRDTFAAAQLFAGADLHQISERLGIRRFRSDPITVAIEAQHRQQREEVVALPSRRRRATNIVLDQILQRAMDIRAELTETPPGESAPEDLALNRLVLRQVLHPERIDLDQFSTEHHSQLQRLLRSYQTGSDVWILTQPAGLALLPRIASGDPIDVPGGEDLAAAWQWHSRDPEEEPS